MQKDNLFYISHIKESILKIEEYTVSRDLDYFLKNTMVQDAVIRNFEIIGEATKNLSNDFRNKYSHIEWRKIAGMRDKLIHDYIGVDLWAVWAVITDVLPEFKKHMDEILEEEA